LRLDGRLPVELVGARLAAEEEVAHVRWLGIIAVRIRGLEEAEEVVADLTRLARLQLRTVALLRDPGRVHDRRSDERAHCRGGPDDGRPMSPDVLPRAPAPRLALGIERFAVQEMVDVPGQRLDRGVPRR